MEIHVFWKKGFSVIWNSIKNIIKSSSITGLEWPRGFQEVKVSRFHDNGTGWW
jgi:hypothetical protein